MKLILLTLIIFSISEESYSRLDDLFDDHTSIKEPFKLRDPFQAPKIRSVKSKKRKQQIKGVWDNIPTIDQNVNIDDVIIKGVLIGKDRRVMISTGKSDTVFTMAEGDYLGRTGPEIKAILPGGIILVEKITNIYGEDEYIETVVPISK